jgi:hypothetical protein
MDWLVKVKKLSAGEIAELVALLLGGSLLAYFSCGSDGDAGPVRPRESKTFSVPRSNEPSPGADDESRSRQRIVEDTLRELLGNVAIGRIGEEQRSEVQLGLIELLERVRWGKPDNRVNAAAVVVQQLFDQAKLQTLTRELTPRQSQAIAALAKELTRQFLLLAVGSSPGADGIDIPLPEGHERVSWNQLGGFPYQEGGSVPSEVLALHGRRVGLPGFMLSSSDTAFPGEFILVESLWGCCFGSVPDVNQTILVRGRLGAAVDYTSGPLVVTGVLEVGEQRQQGFVSSLYRVIDATVRPLDATPQ